MQLETWQLFALVAWASISVGLGAGAYERAEKLPAVAAVRTFFAWPLGMVLLCAAVVLAALAVPALLVWLPFKWWSERGSRRAVANMFKRGAGK
jgi:hypothetical protein